MERMAARAQTILLDMLLAAIAFALAFFVAPTQPELGFGQDGALSFFQLCAMFAALAGIFSLIFQRELSPWRYVSIPDALVLARCALLTAGVFLLAVFVLDRAEGLPRSTLVMAPLLQMFICMGARIARRAQHENALESFSPLQMASDRASPASSLLLIGPSSLADTYLRGVARSHDHPYAPVGIIGTDRREVGQQVRGVCILEAIDRLDEALAEEPGKLKGLTADLLGRLKNDGIRLLRLPSIVELSQHDGVTLLPMRDINIEELLAREPIELDRHAVGDLIQGRRVLITGAGGSIGAELCRQVASFNCARLILLDFSETALFEIEREIRETFPSIAIKAVLSDVRSATRTTAIFARERPELVFHAAALKHVSMVERHPTEGILTNVIGTWNVAEASRACDARQMVLISTDKAVDPTNVMGATKRLAEAVIQAQQSTGEGCRFSAVRFGNVLGSSGSVVPIFKSQIERGGPVTVTHPEMTRFFMTIPEAAQLVLHATATCHADERRDSRLFLLEMGEPVSIMDLAQQMIALSGRRSIDVEITGLRPGEKLTEALLDETERALPCAPKVMEVVSSSALRVMPTHLEALAATVESGSDEDIRNALFDLVGQIRGEKPGAQPTLRVVSGG
ncbi:polysaccharide biosynthesis protein [Phenylobacterium sp.]|jgi:O-antigen biosynthesis protein WbqV|uniref:polysaccharide biosynthesis protein n=1 Tax=Phenylobacterium sp. TaxID=1871053 RepID=UPI0037CAE009